MELYTVEKVSFSYPDVLTYKKEEKGTASRFSLDQVSFTIEEGDFCVLGGASGSGKTTLLRLMKPELTPAGTIRGSVRYCGMDTNEVNPKKSCQEIGYVFQSPDNQLVTDKVWHEMAFGLENAGIEPCVMRRRVAEMADFFGISNWFDLEVNCLSGGQKQLLNLASVMVMMPKVLLLDEPTAQLDPLAAQDFMAMVQRIHQELGTTIVICEHDFDKVLSMCNKMMLLDEGRIIANDNPKKAIEKVENHPFFESFPQTIQVCKRLKSIGVELPCGYSLSVAELVNQLQNLISIGKVKKEKVLAILYDGDEMCKSEVDIKQDKQKRNLFLEGKNLCFSYEKKGKYILDKIDIKCQKGMTCALVGGNGSGKTTLIKLLLGILTPVEGKLYYKGCRWPSNKNKNEVDITMGYLPQNPLDLFTRDTIYEEILETLDGIKGIPKLNRKQKEEKVLEIGKKMNIAHLFVQHPYDLSGGEVQKVALVKILLCHPDILFLDEPTKGMDGSLKKWMKDSIATYNEEGGTVFLVSHDMEFCWDVADYMGMLFLGEMVAFQDTQTFLKENYFYTTQIERIRKGLGVHFYE